AFSWELGYHARWLATDTPLTQFCALELFLLCGAWRARSLGSFTAWYCGAAAAAAAVFACKLTGTLAVLPVMLTPFLVKGLPSKRARLGFFGLGMFVFFVAGFALTPASFLDPLRFLQVLRGGSEDYNTSSHTDPRYVATAFQHGRKTVFWFVGAFPSPFIPVA